MSKRMFAIIKGTHTQAMDAAQKHGVFFDHAETVGTDIYAWADARHERNIVRWFCEATDSPYPVGTCLFYSTPRAEECIQ